MTEEEARRITAAIRDGRDRWVELVLTAYQQRVWAVLRYSDWDEYVRAEIGSLSLPDADREHVMAVLRGAGLSYRATAVVTGTTAPTVMRVVRRAQVLHDETPGRVIGRDGKSYAASRPSNVTPLFRQPADSVREQQLGTCSAPPSSMDTTDAHPSHPLPTATEPPAITDSTSAPLDAIVGFCSTIRGNLTQHRERRADPEVTRLLNDAVDLLARANEALRVDTRP